MPNRASPKTPTTERTESQKLCDMLVKWGMQYEEIAFRLRVSLNSVIRWRRGVKPHPGHMASLRELVEVTRKDRAKKKAAAA